MNAESRLPPDQPVAPDLELPVGFNAPPLGRDGYWDRADFAFPDLPEAIAARAMAVCVDPLQHYVFGGMARLSVEEREACLATLPDGEAEARMAIFPDEPADHVPPMTPVRAKLEAEAEVKADEYRPPLNVAFILCVLWPFCDPLWLDLVARSATEGFNLGFRGPRGPDGNPPSRRPKNMFKTRQQKAVVLDALGEDILRGNATGFSLIPLFAWFRIIAAGVVPKKGAKPWRFVKDYTERKSLFSINALSAKIKLTWCSFYAVLVCFVGAIGGLVSTWDISNAYPSFRIRPQDRHLAMAFIEGSGFSGRISGDMGNARSGYAWEILGGRLLSTLYFVLSFVTTVADDGTVTVDLEGLPTCLRAGQRPFPDLNPEPPAGGFCDPTQERQLHDAARAFFASPEMQARLQRPNGVDLTAVWRWVDDFFDIQADPARARRNNLAVKAWHMMIGLLLSIDKFLPAAVERDFYGFVFNALLGTLSFSPEKLAAFVALLLCALTGKKQTLRYWRRLRGTLAFFQRAAPILEHFVPPIASMLAKAESAVKQRGADAATTPVIGLDDGGTGRRAKAWRACHTLMEWTKHATGSMAAHTLARAHGCAPLPPSDVVHLDWGGAGPIGSVSHKGGAGRVACVVGSRGFAGVCQVDPLYFEPSSGDAGVYASAVGEATALLAALHSYPEVFRSSHVVVFSDSQAFVRGFAKMSSKSQALDDRLRDIAIGLTRLDAYISLYHIPRALNPADALTHTSNPAAQLANANAAWSSKTGFKGLCLRKMSLPTITTSPSWPQVSW